MRYLAIADIYLKQGFVASLSAFDQWPFYSILIAWIHTLLGISLLSAAYTVNGFLDLLTVLVFIHLCRVLGLLPTKMWVAALTILVFHSLNAYRADIIRDHGYWLFMLLSILMLLQFCRHFQWRYAFAWALGSVFATLFRLEGGVLMVMIPFAVFALTDCRWKERCYAFIKLNALNLGFLLAVVLGLWLSPHHHFESGRLMRLIAYPQSIFTQALQHWREHIEGLRLHVLVPDSYPDAPLFLLFGMLGVYVSNFLCAFSWAYAIGAAYAFFDLRVRVMRITHLVLGAYVVINIMITMAFYFHQMFFSERYLFPIALILLCYVPFGLLALYSRCCNYPYKIHRILFALVCVFMLGMLISNLYAFGHSKRYIAEASMWIEQHSVPADVIYTNQAQLTHLASRDTVGWDPNAKYFFAMEQLPQKPWKSGSYRYVMLALNDSQAEKVVEKALNASPVKVFYDKKHTRLVAIFEPHE
jgi:hypothetical protein